MKSTVVRILLLFAIVLTLNSCSSESDEVRVQDSRHEIKNFSYSPLELEAVQLINDYRESKGLSKLIKIDHISSKSEEHNNYMITNSVVNHDDFVSRSQNIIQVLGAKSVSENIAFNYNTPQGALAAWIKSSGHKANIEGDFTHFGLAIRLDANGKKYYTTIFAKI